MSNHQASSPASAPRKIGRRRALLSLGVQAAVLPAASCLTAPGTLAAETDTPLVRFPRMVHEYFVRQVSESEQRHIRNLSRLNSKADAEQYVLDAQARIRQSFGPEPPRTPLNPRVTGTVEHEEYRIENVIFDSRPGFPVTANVYIPKGRTGPLPAVVGTCGHSHNGKAEPAYQSFAQGLARLGFVCLIYDPIGQGERLQYVNEKGGSEIGVGVREHLHGGNQQFLVGDFLGMWRAWDGIRALDYLLTRPDVDKQRVGVTGNSGGGTMTTWLCGLEPRLTMAAPSCFVTTMRRNIENEEPQDTEQCPPQALALNLDHADFLAAMAPKPIIILAKERDFFDVRGAEETYMRLRRLYRLLDAEDNVALFVGPSGHGFSTENREAMYSWFNHASGTAADETDRTFGGTLRATGDVPFTAEPEIRIEKDETLQCTPQGQVAALENTRTVFDFTREKSQQLAAERKPLSGTALRKAVADVLKLPAERGGVPDYRIWADLPARDYPTKHAVVYTIDTEPGIQASVYRLTNDRWYSRPQRTGKRALLYVAHLSSDEELRNEPLIGELMQAEPDSPVFACDVRGIGESLPDTCAPGSFHSAYGSDYMYAIHSLMLDRPYVGQKTLDVLRVLDWLASVGHTEIHIVGRGWGALPATFAAVLSDHVKQVTLKNALTSYSDIAETEHYQWPLATLLPNVLAHFDLPDCYNEVKAKQLRQIEPWNATHA